MSATQLPPWFADACSEVRAAFSANRLAHGLLIHEDPGAGGLELARWITQLVNCRDPRARSLWRVPGLPLDRSRSAPRRRTAVAGGDSSRS